MKRVIAFVTGGYSGEAEVSYKSAINIEAGIDTERYEYYRIDITPASWFHLTREGNKIPLIKMISPRSMEK
jgi:D-alanine-D-alanine ligase